MENREFYSKLNNFITAHHYVNIYSKRFGKSSENRVATETFLARLSSECGAPLLVISNRRFHNCKNEKEEEATFRRQVQAELKKEGLEIKMQKTISISKGLNQLGRDLENRTLLVFHLFVDIHDEKEKDILRSIRKYIEIYDKSAFLSVIVLSDRPTSHWELYPESKLDERHLIYIEYP